MFNYKAGDSGRVHGMGRAGISTVTVLILSQAHFHQDLPDRTTNCLETLYH